jgi:hypothetical protein
LILIIGGSMTLLAPRAVQAQSAETDAVSGFESAGDLLRKCKESSSYSRNFCFAYLAAVADSARSYRIWIGSGDPCLPSGLTLGRLADLFEAYLIANPSLTKAQAASVIVASLQETFPCPAPPQVASSFTAPIPASAPALASVKPSK